MKKKLITLGFALLSIAIIYSCQKLGTNKLKGLIPKLPSTPFEYTNFHLPASFSPNNEGLSNNNSRFDIFNLPPQKMTTVY